MPQLPLFQYQPLTEPIQFDAVPVDWVPPYSDPTRRKFVRQVDPLPFVFAPAPVFTFFQAMSDPVINARPKAISYGPLMARRSPTIATVSDPFFANTILLANFNGSNGQTSWTDQSAAANGAGVFGGSAQISNGVQLFGNNTLLGNSATSNIVTWTNNPTQWNFGTGLYTIEAWVNPNTLAGDMFFVTLWGTQTSWALWYNGANVLWTVLDAPGTRTDLKWTPGLGFTNNWQFLAVDFDGTTVRLYSNGVQQDQININYNVNRNSTTPVAIAGESDGGRYVNGNMGPVRITTGVARYAGTPTVPTAPFPTS